MGDSCPHMGVLHYHTGRGMMRNMTTHAGGVVPEFHLGDRLRKAREHTGMTQGELARVLGVARNTVNRSESGATHPMRVVVRAWAEATGVSLEWLETGEVGQRGEDPEPEQTMLLLGILRAS